MAPWIAVALGLAALLSPSLWTQITGLVALAVAAWLLLSQRRPGKADRVLLDAGGIPTKSWLERVLPIAFPALAALIVLAMLIYTLMQLGWL